MKKEQEHKMNDDDFKEIMSSIGIDVDMDDTEVVQLQDTMESDIILHTKKYPYLKFLWMIPLFVIGLALFIAVIFLSQNKIVKGDIVGSDLSFGEYSVIPSSYVIGKSDLKVGSQIYVKDEENPFFGPLLVDYHTSEVKAINDIMISVSQEGTKDLKNIPIFDILYVKSDAKSAK